MTPGYKQTEIGPAPQDWDERTLSKCAEIDAGINKPLAEMGSGALYVTVQDLYDGTSIDSEQLGRIRVSSREIQTRSLMAGDIVFGKSSVKRDGIGYPSRFVGCREPVVFSGFTYRIRARRGLVDPAFLFHWLRSTKTRRWVIDKSQSSALTNLNRSIADAIPVVLPPLSEQEAIAEALSDADALIDSIEQLLAKKRRLKQGSMQELLTGRRRLPGFSGEWEEKPLGELADVRGGGTPSTSQAQLWDGGVPWCTPTDVTALSGFKYLTSTARTISQQGLSGSSAELIPANSVLMTSRATIGECAINLVPVSTNQGFKNFVPREAVDVEFFYYLLLTQKQGFIKLSAGSTFLEIGKRQLVGYEVRLPATRTEQAAIANVLSDIDAEIVALEAKLTKASALKQGMMQELLTGKIRLG